MHIERGQPPKRTEAPSPPPISRSPTLRLVPPSLRQKHPPPPPRPSCFELIAIERLDSWHLKNSENYFLWCSLSYQIFRNNANFLLLALTIE